MTKTKRFISVLLIFVFLISSAQSILAAAEDEILPESVNATEEQPKDETINSAPDISEVKEKNTQEKSPEQTANQETWEPEIKQVQEQENSAEEGLEKTPEADTEPIVVEEENRELERPVSREAEFVYPEAIELKDIIDFRDQAEDRFKITDGTEIKLEVPDETDPEVNVTKTLAEIKEKEGRAFWDFEAVSEPEPGNYYVLCAPAQDYTFKASDSEPEQYVVIHFTVLQPEPEGDDVKTEEPPTEDAGENTTSEGTDEKEAAKDLTEEQEGTEKTPTEVPEEESLILSETQNENKKEYKITFGNGQNWFLGTEAKQSLLFKSDIPYSVFESVEIDGNPLPETNYTSQSESGAAGEPPTTCITLKGSYLNTLAHGTHTIALVYTEVDKAEKVSGIMNITDPTSIISIESYVYGVTLGTQTLPVSASENVVNKINYANLEEGVSYTIDTWAVDVATMEVIKNTSGEEIHTYAKFTPTALESGVVRGNIELTITLPTEGHEGGTMALFTKLMKTGSTTAEALISDTDNKNTLVRIPELASQARVEGLNTAIPSSVVTIVDTITYGNIDAGEYQIVTMFLDKQTGNYICDAEGNPITKKTSHNLDESGQTAVQIKINARNLEGRDMVICEVLTKKDITLIAHADAEDEEQTIHFTKLQTTATVNNGKTAPAESYVEILDRVTYWNLTEGTRYNLCARLALLSEDGTEYEILEKDGIPIEVNLSFVAGGDGSETEIIIPFDATALNGRKIAVFESVDLEGVRVAEHEDITDENQIITFLQLTANLTDLDGNKEIVEKERINLIDSIGYTTLEPGTEYNVTVELLNPDGTAFENVNHAPVKASKKFTPEGPDGTIDVELDFKPLTLDFGYAVAGIEITSGTTTVATARSLTDENQTVWFPDVDTYATNGNEGKELPAGLASIVDTVHFNGLRPFTTYRVVGTLYRSTDASTPITLADGSQAVTLQYTPAETGGAFDVVLNVDTTPYATENLVVFEEIYNGDRLVAKHTELTDEAQTLTVPARPAIYKVDASTGKPIEGAKILLKDMTTGKSATIVTDSEGIAYYPLANGHTYRYSELEAPEGYQINKNTFSFYVTPGGYVNKDAQTMVNEKIGTVRILKYSVKTGLPIKGALIGIYDSSNKLVYSAQSDRFGYIYFDSKEYTGFDETTAKTAYKTFTAREISAPSGYYLNDLKREFKVYASGEITGNLTMYDAPLGTVTITKTDPDGKPLSGARISVYTGEGRLSGQATTNSDGKIFYTAPAAGTYYFVEDQAPQGYARADKKFAFRIESNGTITGTTTFANNKSGVSTGDDANLLMFMIAGIASSFGLIMFFAVIHTKKTNKKNRRAN